MHGLGVRQINRPKLNTRAVDPARLNDPHTPARLADGSVGFAVLHRGRPIAGLT
jgi:hypothetical protein